MVRGKLTIATIGIIPGAKPVALEFRPWVAVRNSFRGSLFRQPPDGK